MLHRGEPLLQGDGIEADGADHWRDVLGPQPADRPRPRPRPRPRRAVHPGGMSEDGVRRRAVTVWCAMITLLPSHAMWQEYLLTIRTCKLSITDGKAQFTPGNWFCSVSKFEQATTTFEIVFLLAALNYR